jgi:hypothetical protein
MDVNQWDRPLRMRCAWTPTSMCVEMSVPEQFFGIEQVSNKLHWEMNKYVNVYIAIHVSTCMYL